MNPVEWLLYAVAHAITSLPWRPSYGVRTAALVVIIAGDIKENRKANKESILS